MHIFRDSEAIRSAVTRLDDPELTALIAQRLEDLSEYDDCDLSSPHQHCLR